MQVVSKFELPPFNSFTSYNKKKLDLEITNYIGKASNMVVKLTSLDNLIDFTTNNTATLGSMNTLESKHVIFDSVRLNPKAAISDGKAQILVEYTDGNFYDFEVIYLPIKISSPVTNNINMLVGVGERESDMRLVDLHYYDATNAVALSYQNIYLTTQYTHNVYIYFIDESSTYTSAYSTAYNEKQAFYPRTIYAFNNKKYYTLWTMGKYIMEKHILLAPQICQLGRELMYQLLHTTSIKYISSTITTEFLLDNHSHLQAGGEWG